MLILAAAGNDALNPAGRTLACIQFVNSGCRGYRIRWIAGDGQECSRSWRVSGWHLLLVGSDLLLSALPDTTCTPRRVVRNAKLRRLGHSHTVVHAVIVNDDFDRQIRRKATSPQCSNVLMLRVHQLPSKCRLPMTKIQYPFAMQVRQFCCKQALLTRVCCRPL